MKYNNKKNNAYSFLSCLFSRPAAASTVPIVSQGDVHVTVLQHTVAVTLPQHSRTLDAQNVKAVACHNSRLTSIGLCAIAGAAVGFLLATVIVPHITFCVAAHFIIAALKHAAVVSAFTWGMTGLGGVLGCTAGAAWNNSAKNDCVRNSIV